MKNLFLVLIITLSVLSMYGQSEKPDSLNVDQVEIIKAFDAQLKDAKMIDIQPALKATEPTQNRYTYKITVVPMEIAYPDPIIKPLAMGADPEKNVDKFYAKLGYGTLNTPYADVSYQLITPDLLDMHIYGKLHGYDNSDEIEFQKAMKTNFGLYGSYRMFDNTQMGFDIGGGTDLIGLYDTTPSATLPNIEIDRERSTVNMDLNINFENVETSSYGINYDIGAGVDYINFTSDQSDFHTSIESNHKAHLNLEKEINDNIKAVFYNDIYATSVGTGFDSVALTTINLRPGLVYSNDVLTANVKADLLFQNGELSPFIEAEIAYSLMEQQFQIYAGVDQVVNRNTRFTLYKENPFIDPFIDDRVFNSVSQQYYLGFRSEILSKLSFDVNVGYEDIEHLSYYTGISVYPYIILGYNEDKVSNVFVQGKIAFSASEHIKVGGSFKQNFLDDDPIDRPYRNQPTFIFDTYGEVNLLDDKLNIRADLQVGNAVHYIEAAQEVEGNSLTRLNLEAKYFPLQSLGVWARANNIFDNQYIRFKGYPTIGVNFQGGIIVKF